MRQKAWSLGNAEAVTDLLLRCSASSTAALRRLGSLYRGHLLCELIILSVICSLYHIVPVCLFCCRLHACNHVVEFTCCVFQPWSR